MSSEQQTTFQENYQAGQQALERGQYRASIHYLETACGQINRFSRQGGEAQIWLVSAYQAANETQAAIALCEKLLRHPSPTTSKQAKDLLYIIKSPVLKRPENWMTKIPELNSLDESQLANHYAGAKLTKRKPKPKPEREPLPLSEVNTQDNLFVRLAVVLILLGFLGFFVINN